MTWILVTIGLLLLLLGLWGGPTHARSEREKEYLARQQPTVNDAWTILSEPVPHKSDLIKIPEHKPWYVPGKDRRFRRGLSVGLGGGLVIAALVAVSGPRPAAQAAATAPATAPSAPAASAPASGAAAAAAAPIPAKQAAPVSFTVNDGDLPPNIADHLKAAGLIKDTAQFLSRISERGVDTGLKAGTFSIPADATLDQVIDALTH